MIRARFPLAGLILILAASGCGWREFRSMEDVGQDESVVVIRVRARINERYVTEWPTPGEDEGRYRFTLTSSEKTIGIKLPQDGIFAFVIRTGDYEVASRLRYEPRDIPVLRGGTLKKLEIGGKELVARFEVDGEEKEQKVEKPAPFLDYMPKLQALPGKICSLGDRQVDVTGKVSVGESSWDCRAGPRPDADFKGAIIAKYPGLKGGPFLPGGP